MSVAFRRESDEEHLEPKFEIPVPLGPNLVTARGLGLITARVTELETLLPGVTETEPRKQVQRDLRYWRLRLATAELLPAPAGHTVQFGSRVTYRRGGKLNSVTIVGHDEADPGQQLVSFLAPLCRALLGAEPGETVEFGGGLVEITALG